MGLGMHDSFCYREQATKRLMFLAPIMERMSAYIHLNEDNALKQQLLMRKAVLYKKRVLQNKKIRRCPFKGPSYHD